MTPDAAAPIFVVGAPRTGTTLVREILNLHPQVHLFDEVHFNERVRDVLAGQAELREQALNQAVDLTLADTDWVGLREGRAEARARLRKATLAAGISFASLLRAFLEIEASEHGKSIWGDSSPQDVLYLDNLKAWYPAARIVGVVRDPRAYLASYKSYVRKGVASYRDRYNPVTNSLLWRTYMNSLMAADRKSWRADVCRLHYEALVTEPDKQIERLCEFLGLEFSQEMLAVGRQNSSYIAVQEDYQAQGISTGSLERWRTVLDPAELWTVQRICAEPMTALGYRPEGGFPGPRHWHRLLVIGALLPGRLFNMLFRGRKPFTLGKLRKVLASAGRSQVR